MKKLALISALTLSGFIYNNANAQVRISVGFNLGGPVVVQRPVPVATYADDYYYLPEVDAYYSVGENLYYYNNGFNWVSAVYLPGAYRNYNWRNVRRVELHAYRPYMNHNVYRTRYRGNQFDWRRFDNRNDGRGFDNRNDRRDWDNRGNNNRPDWNDRDRRSGPRNDNRDNDNRGNGRFDRPSQNDNRGRGNDNRPNFVNNGNDNRRGAR